MKRINLLFLLLSLCTSVMAQEITIDVAKGRALEFLSRQSINPKYAKGTSLSTNLSLAYTSKSEGKTCFYVFNVGDGDGFVIAGGDEAALDILGYSTCGTFDYDTAPDNFRWWLSQYTEQIAHAEAPSQEALAAMAAYRAKAAQTRDDVAPLMETYWKQDYPYNSEIPVYESNGARYVTGCVATAMAQVMKRWNYPEHGLGSYSYTLDGNTFSADFENTTYDWDNMLTSYKGRPITDDNIKAVGTLMYHAGVAVRMNYGVGESSSSHLSVGPALVKYFGYDKSVRQESRPYFTDEGWEDLIYNELSAGHPVLYSGKPVDSDSGHAFVCDGFEASTNMFHINWGWGVFNNYFTLRGDNALVPSGIGTDGYNQGQEITVNVKPDNGSVASPHIVLGLGDYAMYMEVNREKYDDNYTYDKGMGNKKLSYHIDVLNHSCVFNNVRDFPEDANVNIQLGIKVIERESSTVQYFSFGNSILLKNEIINLIYGFSTNINLSDFEYNGTYELHPVFRIEGTEEWMDIQVPVAETIPTITILGAENRTPTNVHFFISSSEMVEEETVQITHDSNYQGAITYSSSNPDVATVDAQGVVTGVSAGTAVITVRGEADPDRLYLATEATFEVQVIHIDNGNPNFSIEKTDIVKGDVVKITWDKNYDGELTFTSSNPAIAQVNAQGKVTAVAVGTVEITAQATETPLYIGCQTTFNVTVHPLKITFVEGPYFNNDNNAYRNDVVMHYKVRNDCGVTHDFTVSTTLYLTDALIASPGKKHRSVPDGGIVEGSIDFDNYIVIMENSGKLPDANKQYTVYVSVENGSSSLKYPDVNFIYRNTLELDYGVSPAGYCTLILPFNAELPEGMKVYSCSEVDANGVLNLVEESSIRRNAPYIVMATPGNYTFTGPEAIDADKPSFQEGILVGAVSNNVSLQKGTDYILQEQNGKVAFYKYTGTRSENANENDSDGNRLAKPFRAFIRLDGSSHAPMINFPGFSDGEETGIKEIKKPSNSSNLSNLSNSYIYTLDGKRQSTFQKGLNILILDDGTAQKVFIK